MGGNVAILVWRYDEEPELWHITVCFRYYRDDVAFESEDRKSWNFWAVKSSEEQMRGKLDSMTTIISGSAGLFFGKEPPPVYRLEIAGDWEKFKTIVEREKPFWLHTGAPR